MELINCKVGVPFDYNGKRIVARLTKNVKGEQICASCVLHSKELFGQCKHIKECIAYKRPDHKSVVFKMAKTKKETKQ